MSTEEFNSIQIPFKGTNGIVSDHEVLLKKTLKFGEFGTIMQKGGFNIETSTLTNIQAFMTTLIQFTIHKAPFDHKRVENILDLDTKIAMKIFTECLKALPLEDLGKDFGIGVPTSLLKTD